MYCAQSVTWPAAAGHVASKQVLHVLHNGASCRPALADAGRQSGSQVGGDQANAECPSLGLAYTTPGPSICCDATVGIALLCMLYNVVLQP